MMEKEKVGSETISRHYTLVGPIQKMMPLLADSGLRFANYKYLALARMGKVHSETANNLLLSNTYTLAGNPVMNDPDNSGEQLIITDIETPDLKEVKQLLSEIQEGSNLNYCGVVPIGRTIYNLAKESDHSHILSPSTVINLRNQPYSQISEREKILEALFIGNRDEMKEYIEFVKEKTKATNLDSILAYDPGEDFEGMSLMDINPLTTENADATVRSNLEGEVRLLRHKYTSKEKKKNTTTGNKITDSTKEENQEPKDKKNIRAYVYRGQVKKSIPKILRADLQLADYKHIAHARMKENPEDTNYETSFWNNQFTLLGNPVLNDPAGTKEMVVVTDLSGLKMTNIRNLILDINEETQYNNKDTLDIAKELYELAKASDNAHIIKPVHAKDLIMNPKAHPKVREEMIYALFQGQEDDAKKYIEKVKQIWKQKTLNHIMAFYPENTKGMSFLQLNRIKQGSSCYIFGDYENISKQVCGFKYIEGERSYLIKSYENNSQKTLNSGVQTSMFGHSKTGSSWQKTSHTYQKPKPRPLDEKTKRFINIMKKLEKKYDS